MNKYLRQHHRIIKVFMGIILAGLGYFFSLWWLYLIAAIFLIMAIANICLADYFEGKGKARKKKK